MELDKLVVEEVVEELFIMLIYLQHLLLQLLIRLELVVRVEIILIQIKREMLVLIQPSVLLLL